MIYVVRFLFAMGNFTAQGVNSERFASQLHWAPVLTLGLRDAVQWVTPTVSVAGRIQIMLTVELFLPLIRHFIGETREEMICRIVAVEVAKPQHGHWQLTVRNIRVGVWSSGLPWNLHCPF